MNQGRSPLAALVQASLPPAAKWAEENFAGDPLVADFVRVLRDETGQDVKVFVTWECPPLVTILLSTDGSAVVRSERFDALLVEYHRLMELAQSPALYALQEELVGSTVCRWISELLLGVGRPGQALAALERKRTTRTDMDFSPFRDENLASISELQRAAIQCFSIAHEIGHTIFAQRDAISFDTSIDGISIARHLTRDVVACEDDVRDRLVRILRENVSPPTLFAEFEADVFALQAVVRYLKAVCPSCASEEIIDATLRACEATFALGSCLQTCDLLAGVRPDFDFVHHDFIATAQMAARGAVVMRRASILWAHLQSPNRPLKASDVNPYASLVDAMLIGRQPLLLLVTEKIMECSRALLRAQVELTSAQLQERFAEQLEEIKNNPELRWELSQMLVAFGAPGGVDVATYIEDMGRARGCT